jgi:predicted TIM-barrel fold metal-dependent hydrolase
MHEVDPSLRGKILAGHDRQRFLFGTDSPWGDQKAQVEFIRDLPEIGDDFKEGIFFRNAVNLLGRS